MKLQSQKAAKYKGKEYHKFWVVIPNTLIEEAGWEPGTTLKGEMKGNKLVIEAEE